MKIFILLGVSAALFLTGMSASAADPFAGETGSYYAQLEQYAKDKRSITTISDRINAELTRDPRQLPLVTDWAKKRAIGATDPSLVNGLYFMVYSDLTRRTAKALPKTGPNYAPTSHEALQALLIFDAITTADFARCKSAADAGVVKWIVEPRHKALNYVYALLTPEETEAIWANALNMEAATGARLPNAEVCSNTLAVEMTYGDHPQEKVPAAFIPTPEWDAKRTALRDEIMNSWRAHYNTLAAPQ
ncbi:MAG: hypothetical protein PSY14_04395 [bacterium]|nr:hypothetical protein [bacterium]